MSKTMPYFCALVSVRGYGHLRRTQSNEKIMPVLRLPEIFWYDRMVEKSLLHHLKLA
ncbi:hypothetical protein RvY_11744 [Ramazzottius varieornatus]|uniref:Uncharacterized protein n=1 Tax=Ramazzottius varieornatus TaxID=947166 RepID=A0A1D1VH35_RAMVA|nr:hypothetical protein RvY_11744 [Ramazzottius varieornatus]